MYFKKKIVLFVVFILAFTLSTALTYGLVIDAQDETKCSLGYCATTIQLDKYFNPAQITTLKTVDLKPFLPNLGGFSDVNYKYTGNNLTIYGGIKIGSANYWSMNLNGLATIDPWWNTSYQYCKNISLVETKGINRTFEPMKVNLTGLTKLASNDDVRITNSYCQNGGTEQPRDVLSSDTTWAYVLIEPNYTTTDTDHKWAVYYNSPTAPPPSYTGTLTLTGSSTQYNVTVTNQYKMVYESNFRDGGIHFTYYNGGTTLKQWDQFDDQNGANPTTLTTIINGTLINQFWTNYSTTKAEKYECYDKNMYCRIEYYKNPSNNYYTVYPLTAPAPLYWTAGSWSTVTVGNKNTIAIAWDPAVSSNNLTAQVNITGWTNEGCMRTDTAGWYTEAVSGCTFGTDSGRKFYILFNLPDDSNATLDKLLNSLSYALEGEETETPTPPVSYSTKAIALLPILNKHDFELCVFGFCDEAPSYLITDANSIVTTFSGSTNYSNYSQYCSYVNNATERELFNSTYNATYDSKINYTYNSSYDATFNWYYNKSNPSNFWNNSNTIITNSNISNYAINNTQLLTGIVNQTHLTQAFALPITNLSWNANMNTTIYNITSKSSSASLPICWVKLNSTGKIHWCSCYNDTLMWDIVTPSGSCAT